VRTRSCAYCSHCHGSKLLPPSRSETTVGFRAVEVGTGKEVSGRVRPRLPAGAHLQPDLPEYNEPFIRRYGIDIAYDRGRWLLSGDDWRAGRRKLLAEATIVRLMPGMFFGEAESRDPGQASAVVKLCDRFPDLIVEANQLVSLFPEAQTGSYAVGVRARKVHGLVAVSVLSADHPGRRVDGVGEWYPRYYTANGDRFLQEVKLADSCPCNNERKHSLALRVLTRVAVALQEGEGELVTRRKRVYFRYRDSEDPPPALARLGLEDIGPW
jgi:hypothetical protein